MNSIGTMNFFRTTDPTDTTDTTDTTIWKPGFRGAKRCDTAEEWVLFSLINFP